MFKFLAILCIIGTVAKAQQLKNNASNIDEYIDQNRQQYAQNIRDYDQRMETFKESYMSSIQLIPKRLDLLVESIHQTEQRLNSLQILSDLSEKCVNQYRTKLPNVMLTKQEINICYTTASSQKEYLVQAAYGTRVALDSYYKYNFEGSLQSCKVQLGDYNTCVITAVASANAYTASNRKTFDTQMLSAQKSANASFDSAFQCSYTTQNQVTTAIAETNVLTDRCLQGLKDCKPCSNQGYSCPNVSFLQPAEVNYNNPLMYNVFYERYDVKECLMLKIYN